MAGSVVAFMGLLLSRKGIRSGGWAAGLEMLMFIGTLVMANPTTRGRLHEIVVLGAEAPAIASRLWLQKVACSMWTERPWTGWGPGAYAIQYTERLGDVLPEEKNHAILKSLVHAREPHHDLLQFGAEFGLIGAALAADLLARRMELWPEKDAAALGRLATLYHRAGEYEKVLWAVYRLRPRMDVYVEELYPETMNLAGATLIQLGRPDEAVVWLERALVKNPQLLSAQKNLENLRGARGEGP